MCSKKGRINHISNITSKRNFYRKFYQFFQMQKKPKPCRNSNLKSCKRPSFVDYIHAIFIWWQHLHCTLSIFIMFCKFYPNIVQTLLLEENRYLSQTFNCLGLTKFSILVSNIYLFRSNKVSCHKIAVCCIQQRSEA